MIASQVILPGQKGTEVELRLESGGGIGFTAIYLTVRVRETLPPCREKEISMKLNRGSALAVSNILSGWAPELPVWPLP